MQKCILNTDNYINTVKKIEFSCFDTAMKAFLQNVKEEIIKQELLFILSC